jgi:transcriptional regulator with XRE-family HTH domain
MTTSSLSPPSDIARTIRARRVAAGLTQRQLAQLARCSLSTITNIEAGCVPKRSELLPRLVAALDGLDRPET